MFVVDRKQTTKTVRMSPLESVESSILLNTQQIIFLHEKQVDNDIDNATSRVLTNSVRRVVSIDVFVIFANVEYNRC
jgi:hypothetical protein